MRATSWISPQHFMQLSCTCAKDFLAINNYRFWHKAGDSFSNFCINLIQLVSMIWTLWTRVKIATLRDKNFRNILKFFNSWDWDTIYIEMFWWVNLKWSKLLCTEPRQKSHNSLLLSFYCSRKMWLKQTWVLIKLYCRGRLLKTFPSKKL